MDDHWRRGAEEARDNIEQALGKLQYVEAIVFDGQDAEDFDDAFWTLQRLGSKLERDLEESE